jgi:hypothetical protein
MDENRRFFPKYVNDKLSKAFEMAAFDAEYALPVGGAKMALTELVTIK